MRKILVLSAATDDIEYQYRLTNSNKQLYCKQYGYDYKFIKLEKPKGQYPHMLKPQLIRNEIMSGGYDYVLWMDCDAWFHNFGISIDSLIDRYPNASLIAAHDDEKGCFPKNYHDAYINSGVLLFKMNTISMNILSLWEHPNIDQIHWMRQHSPLHDQPYLSIRILFDQFVGENTKVVYPQAMNKFVFSGYDDETFILHYPGTTERKDKGIARWNEFAVGIIRTN